MVSSRHSKLLMAACFAAGFFLLVNPTRSIHAQNGKPNPETTNVIVNVREADTGEPVSQASVTLQFTAPAAFGTGKKHTYNAKADAQGRCKLFGINKGTILLMVTAHEHQSYGKELQLDQENQVFEVKLKKPQPLI